MITKTDFATKLLILIEILLQIKQNILLLIENELKKLKIFDLGYFIGKSYFDEDVTSNYLVFQSMLQYFMLNSKWIAKCKSKGLSN